MSASPTPPIVKRNGSYATREDVEQLKLLVTANERELAKLREQYEALKGNGKDKPS